MAGKRTGSAAAKKASRPPAPELGLVCQTFSDQVRFCTITLSRYRTLNEHEQQAKLRELYRENIRRLLGALAFCRVHSIRLYRMPSGLFPMSDEPLGETILREMADDLAMVGRLAELWSLRLVMHPDQFVVLNSHRPEVTAQSIMILRKQALWMDLMHLPRSPWCALILHGGVMGRSEELKQTIASLDDSIRSRLVLENDEWSYSASEILQVCRDAAVPMVFDAHHHLIREKLKRYDDPSIAEMTQAAAATWPDSSWAIVHVSNGIDGVQDRRHSDYVKQMPEAFRRSPWIEVEAKAKELAIDWLRENWLKRKARKTTAKSRR